MTKNKYIWQKNVYKKNVASQQFLRVFCLNLILLHWKKIILIKYFYLNQKNKFIKLSRIICNRNYRNLFINLLIINSYITYKKLINQLIYLFNYWLLIVVKHLINKLIDD